MKKIAFICELVGTPREGGENLAMLRVATALKKKGYIVDIYTYASEDKKLKITSKIPLFLRLLPFVREMFCVPIIGYGLLKKLDTHYDAIFASSMTIASFYKPKSPLIITCHLIRSQKFSSLSKIFKYKLLFNPITYFFMTMLEKKALIHTAKIIVLREQQKKYLQQKLHVPEEKIHIIPNGIDVDFFKPLKMQKKNQVIFVGRGTLPKGIDTLLQAADAIPATILIVTQKIDALFSAIAKEKPNVVIKQKMSPKEIVLLYAESKIFILPSLNEEQPLSTMEAMACGLPVVVTPEAASDIVTDGVHGYIIPEKNPQVLSQKVTLLLADETMRTNMGVKSRQHIVENYNLEKIIRMTEKLLL